MLPRTACGADLHMDDGFDLIVFFLVWPLPETAMGSRCNCLVGGLPYTHYMWGAGAKGITVVDYPRGMSGS